MALALLFSGQGAQKVGMGRSLYEQSAAARARFDEADSILSWSLSRTCFEGPEEDLTQTKVCQPALYVHGLALLAALQELGKLTLPDSAVPSSAHITIERAVADYLKPAASPSAPSFALGLSLGEITAYAAAGVFDFATGLKLVAERGRLMQLACEQTQGSMAAILGESREAVAALCEEFDIEAANFNAPGQIIVSGEEGKVATAVTAAKAAGKKVIPLNVAGAYHSRLMESARTAFAEVLREVEFSRPKFAVFTNTTGRAISEPEELRAALAAQVVSSVLWEDCMRSAVAAGASEFWELGPGGVLAGLARRTEKSWSVKSFSDFDDLAKA